jgi:hypothetical protein
MKKRLPSLINMPAAILVVFMLTVLITATLSAENRPKDFQIQTKAGKSGLLEMQFKSNKNTYRVGEPITFDIQASKAAYVYLYSMKGDDVTLVFPNRFDTGNRVAANTSMNFPVQSQFKADRPGIESVILVASTEKLSLGSEKSISDIVSKLFFGKMAGSIEDVQMESMSQMNRCIVIKEVLIQGKDGSPAQKRLPQPDAGVEEPVSVLLSTSKPVYGLDESMIISYAADADGFVGLYAVNPEGEIAQLKVAPVEKGKIYRLKAVTEKPAGQHMLVGMYYATEPAQSAGGFGKLLFDQSVNGAAEGNQSETSGKIASPPFDLPESFLEFLKKIQNNNLEMRGDSQGGAGKNIQPMAIPHGYAVYPLMILG